MPAQRLEFDILARDNASSGFVKAGRAAAAASDDVMGLAKRLDEVGRKSATARVGLAGDKEAQAQLDKLDLKLLTVGRRVTDPKITLDGAARASAEISALGAQLDKLGSKGESAEAAVGSGGLAGPGGMGALIGAGVALTPVLLTVATGVAGFGLAAYGALSPVMKAAQATGGLAKNMNSLDAGQQGLARSILHLGDQFHQFSGDLEPEALTVFGKGVQLAGHLMHDVEPVARTMGSAIGGLLDRVDAEFQSGTWQSFFGFMAKTAGPDIALLGNNITDLLTLLPELATDLQPVATALLKDTDGAVKLTTALVRLVEEEHQLSQRSSESSGFLGTVAHAIGQATDQMVPGAKAARTLGGGLEHMGSTAGKAGGQVGGLNVQVSTVRPEVTALSSAVAGLTANMKTNIGTVLTLQGDDISWRQALQAAAKQLDSNSAGLSGNSKAALANKQAVLQASSQAMTFAQDQLTTGGNLQAASRRIQDQIEWLQKHGEKSKFARKEIHAFRMEEALIKQSIASKITVYGSGKWSVIGPGGGLPGGTVGGPFGGNARGALVTAGTGPTADDVLARVSRGETIVPARLTPAIAPLMAAHGVPGFAAGGVVGGFSGTVPGLGKWMLSERSATVHSIAAATAAAVASAMAGGGVAGPGGGAPGANAALARLMYPQWATGANWQAWNYVAMRESGWNNHALNLSSGAYGIPQALPPTKMPLAAQAIGGSNPAAQIGWMASYMAGRYGGPQGAAAHEMAFNWYDQGGVMPPGLSLAYNGTGAPEPLTRGGGNTYSINVHVAPGGSPAETGRQVVSAIKEFERRSGKSWRS